MENKYSFEVINLSSKQLEEINGGYNILEYIAKGIGYVVGAFSDIEPGSNYDSQYDYVHNSGGNKW